MFTTIAMTVGKRNLNVMLFVEHFRVTKMV